MKTPSSISRFTSFRIASCILLLGMLLFSVQLKAQLDGTYKLHPTDGDADFKTFAEVADTLKKSGISGSVTINVLPGTYTDVHIIIDTIVGSANDKWVVFQSSTGDSTDVTLSYNYTSDASQNWMFLMRGATYVTFKQMTFVSTAGDSYYGKIFYLGNACNYINFLNNSFHGKTGRTSDRGNLIHGLGDKIEYIVIEHNAFYDGEDAINLNGLTSGDLSKGNVIRYNEFYNQTGESIWLDLHDAPIISDNFFDINPDGKYAISMQYCDNAFRITNNTIEIEKPTAAVHLYRCDGIVNTEGLIANNFIDIYYSGYENTGIRLQDCDNIHVYHNTVMIHGGWQEDSRCFYQYSGGSNQDIRNNIFANFNGGYAANFASNGGVSNTNNNNYYTNGNYIVKWGTSATTSNKRDLKAFQAARGAFDNASISVHPAPTSWVPQDFHTTSYLLKDAGVDLTTDVPEDIDGETRSSTPCIGADEFTTATGAPLTGTITIGSDQELTSLQHVIDSMNLYGISGPVTINIKDNGSPYDEQILIEQITGADADNRVTIQADPGNTGDVIIQFSAQESWSAMVVRLLRTSYISLKNITISSGNATYPNVISFEGYSVHDSILNCTLNTSGGTSGNLINASGDEVSDIAIIGNTITDGGSAINIVGISSTASQPRNITISNNTLNNQYGSVIYLDYCNAPVVTNNNIESRVGTSNGRGINLYRCPGGVTVTGNTVINRDADYGIAIDNCTGSFGSESLVANNTVNVTGGTSTVIGIRTSNSDYVNVYFNTVRIAGGTGNTSSNAYENYNGSHINVQNNIFYNRGDGRAYYNEQTNAIDASNNNVIFALGLYIARWGTSEKTTLAAWQAASGMDDLSMEANPAIKTSEDLHPNSYFLDGAGADITGITLDKDGVTRDSPPDIGAYEFSSSLTPMSGTYYIHGDSPDFTSMQQVADSLHRKGINGPVELLIRTGNYQERFSISNITGSSAQNPLVIRSESGNPEDVIISWDQEASTFALKKVSHITIRDLTLSCSNLTGGRPLGAWGTFSNMKIINNILVSANIGWGNLSMSACITDSVTIKDNILSKGEWGIYFTGNSSIPSTNTQIIGNTITGAYDKGIYMRYHTNPVVTGSTISNSLYTYFEGIELRECHGKLNVSGNSVNNTSSGDGGIYLYDCHSTELFNGLVSNNMIHVGGTYIATGIYLNSSEYINLYSNTVNITSTDANSGRCIYVNSTNVGIDIVNNVLANFGTGRALELTQSADVLTVDNNCYYSESTSKFVYWGGTEYTDLASLKAASSKDVSSIEEDPQFYSTSDLRSKQIALHQAAIPLPEVTHDIDSILRDPTKPDMGASEFSCVSPTFNIYMAPSCQGDSTIIIDSSLNIAPGSKRYWDLTGNGEVDAITKNDFDTIIWTFPNAGINVIAYSVQQIAGCIDETNVDVPITPAPLLDITTKGAYCDTTDGWAMVDVTNLSGPFNYFWSDGQTDSTAVGLAIGTYTVAVTDETGCLTTEDVSIGEAIEVSVTQISPSTCGVPDGSATVSAVGGYAPYTYVWSNGDTSATNTSLSPGPNYVNVIDSKGCYAQGSINITSDGGPQVSLIDVSHNDCYGGKNGKIDISVSGGLQPYSILWSNGETSEDIDSLAAGIYNVTVTADDKCLGAGSFQVFQPSRIAISPVTTPATCESPDGTATAVVSGGTKPYTYSWSSGGIYQIEEGLAAGVYSVTVTDGKSCKMVEPVFVNDIGAPKVAISGLQGVGCTVIDNGSINIDVTPPSLTHTYSWSTEDGSGVIAGDKNQSGLTEGTYKVTVTNTQGCKGVSQAMVIQEPPDINPICIVSVDTLSGKNMIVWEKLVTEDVSHYNIYRESSVKGDYHVIASVGFNEESIYVDSIADPTIRSWRYRLSVVDDCGNESELSKPHKTMHLTMNVGLDESVNLIWDHYEGFDISTYEIWRYDAASLWTNIENMPSNLTSYTDAIPPKEDLTYFIEVDHPLGCTSTDKKASTLNSSRSNRKTKLRSSVDNQAPTDISLDVSNIDENESIGSLVGRFTTTDPDEGDTHTYSLIAGTGGEDNSSFSITGDSLLSAGVFDYESKNTYSILVSTTDTFDLSFEKSFVITINDSAAENQAPTGISLDVNNIDENESIGSLVGRFTTIDPDGGDTHIYSLSAGLGSDDNSSFSIKGDSLLSAEVFDYETKNTYSILVSTTDKGGLSFEKSSVITINDVVEVGLNQISEYKFKIYPNPGTGVFNLSMDLDDLENVSVKILDVSGKLIIAREYKNIPFRLDTQFDLTGFADGIYQIHVRTSNTLLHRILIKE